MKKSIVKNTLVFLLISFISFISIIIGMVYVKNRNMKYERINKGDHLNKVIMELGQPTLIDTSNEVILYRYYIYPVNVFKFSFNRKDSLMVTTYRE